MISVGLLAVIYPASSTAVSQLVIGWVFLMAGLFMVGFSYSVQEMGSFAGVTMTAILLTFSGAGLISYPTAGAIGLSLLVALLLLVQAVADLYIANVYYRKRGRFWLIVSGGLGIAMTVAIMWTMPAISNVLLGFYVGLNFLVFGVALIALSDERDAVQKSRI